MKKVFFILAFMLIGTFVFADTLENSVIDNTKIEQSVKDNSFDYDLDYKIQLEEDICTVTITIRYSDGSSYSATASNNQGDCGAAKSAALSMASLIASVLR